VLLAFVVPAYADAHQGRQVLAAGEPPVLVSDEGAGGEVGIRLLLQMPIVVGQ
jgi:hypothetical protein